MTDPWKQAFARFLDAAGPYLDQLVVAGGWASRLYRLTDRSIESDFVPLLTRDVDAVIPDRMPSRERGLNELMVASNFTEEPSSEFTPPITHYVLDKPKGFEVEFLTNLPGGVENTGATAPRMRPSPSRASPLCDSTTSGYCSSHRGRSRSATKMATRWKRRK